MNPRRDETNGRKAVALKYDEQSAPKVTAKGEGALAEEILRLAEAHGVHIHEDPGLSQLLSRLELGTEIPRELYVAVAQVIAFAYVLKGKFPAGRKAEDYAQ